MHFIITNQFIRHKEDKNSLSGIYKSVILEKFFNTFKFLTINSLFSFNFGWSHSFFKMSFFNLDFKTITHLFIHLKQVDYNLLKIKILCFMFRIVRHTFLSRNAKQHYASSTFIHTFEYGAPRETNCFRLSAPPNVSFFTVHPKYFPYLSPTWYIYNFIFSLSKTSLYLLQSK